jgi:hypothetical protein
MDESVRDGEGPEAVRNVAILGHPAAGVTELTCGIQACDETPISVLNPDDIIWIDL